MKKLTTGDTIGIISPSNPITAEKRIFIDNTVKKFESIGLKVQFSKNAFNIDKYWASAGTPEQRAQNLNDMFSDPNIDAIYCSQGGNTANQLLPLIDFENIKKNPKPFLGMSDIDVLHLAIHTQTGINVFHGSTPKIGQNRNLDQKYTWENFQNRMMLGEKNIPSASDRICIRKWKASGKIIGCNQESILVLAGTKYFPDFSNSILFLEGFMENTKETIYTLQRLKEIGVFNQIKGLVIWYILGFQDEEIKKRNNITTSYEDIVLDMTKEFSFPIIKTNDFGHGKYNCYLPIGAKVQIDTQDLSIHILEDFLQ